MDADVGRQRQQIAAREVTLGERTPDVDYLILDSLDICGARRTGRIGLRIVLPGSDPAQLPQDVLARASGEAGDENAPIALADRKTGVLVGMRRATAHADMTTPSATEDTDDIDQLLRGSFGYKRGYGSPTVVPVPLPSRSKFDDRCDNRNEATRTYHEQ